VDYGDIKLFDLKEQDIYEILKDILDACVTEAGDSYDEFGRSVFRILMQEKLIDY
jgi:hypothetical protein